MAEFSQISIPMHTAFVHTKASRLSSESLILILMYDGIKGIGECAPRRYVTGETISSVTEEILNLNIGSLLNKINFKNLDTSIESLGHLKELEFFYKAQKFNVVCIIEMALLDLIGKIFNVTLQKIISKYFLSQYFTNLESKEFYPTSQVLDLSMLPDCFLDQRRPFHHIKIKVGSSTVESVKLIETIRKKVGNNIPICVDANMAWNLEEAIDAIKNFEQFNIKFYEEPLAKGDLLSYKKLRSETGAKILLDESLCSLEDAINAIHEKAVDAFNIRISKCGGILKSARLANLAIENSIKIQLGAQVAETGPLIAASRHLVFALKNCFAYEAGQPDYFFKDHYIIDPMPLVDRRTNFVKPLLGHGLGIETTENLAIYTVKKFKWNKNWSSA